MGDAQVRSAALHAAPARFDTEVVHHARVAQLAEAAGSEPVCCRFDSCSGYVVPHAPLTRGSERCSVTPRSPVRDRYGAHRERWPRGKVAAR